MTKRLKKQGSYREEQAWTVAMKQLGGERAVRNLWQQCGGTKQAVSNWKKRGRIPLDSFFQMRDLALPAAERREPALSLDVGPPREWRQRRLFTVGTECLLRLTEAALRDPRRATLLSAIVRVLEQASGWNDSDWQALYERRSDHLRGRIGEALRSERDRLRAFLMQR